MPAQPGSSSAIPPIASPGAAPISRVSCHCGCAVCCCQKLCCCCPSPSLSLWMCKIVYDGLVECLRSLLRRSCPHKCQTSSRAFFLKQPKHTCGHHRISQMYKNGMQDTCVASNSRNPGCHIAAAHKHRCMCMLEACQSSLSRLVGTNKVRIPAHCCMDCIREQYTLQPTGRGKHASTSAATHVHTARSRMTQQLTPCTQPMAAD